MADHCLIIGASHAGAQAAMRLRRLGWDGAITLVGEEPQLPYHRPPLSKDFLKGNKTAAEILINPEAAYEKARVDIRLSQRALRINRSERTVDLSSGDSLSYSKLVLAVGARPRELPVPGAHLSGVHYMRSAQDADRIRVAATPGQRAAIIGGGYIGLETAASLRMLGMEVLVLEALERVLQRVTCEPASAFFSRVHREEGVVIRESTQVTEILGSGSVTGLKLQSGDIVESDLVVVGIGVLPNTELAEQAGLAISNGIHVNACGQTSDPDVYAIGDCVSFVHPRYGRQIRLESVQNANDQATAAAKAICGQVTSYDAVPWFWSDQFDVKMQIAGLSEGADEIVVRGNVESGRALSILYLQGRRLLAVDAMNCPRDFVSGKKLIAEKSKLDLDKLRDENTSLKDAVLP